MKNQFEFPCFFTWIKCEISFLEFLCKSLLIIERVNILSLNASGEDRETCVKSTENLILRYIHSAYYFQDIYFEIVMRGILRGTLYCALWYGSIVAGFLFIACPLLPLLLFSPPRFRKCGDLLFSCWELYPTVSKSIN